MAKIQRKRIKILRKMYKARKNVEIKNEKRDIIEEYANFGSTVYAPITRHGLSLDKKANKYEVQPEALSSYQGLRELHTLLESKKPHVFDSKVNIDMVRHNFKKSQTRKEDQHLKALKAAQRIIDLKFEQMQDQRNAAAEDDKNATERNVRPSTPKFAWSNLGISQAELMQEDKA